MAKRRKSFGSLARYQSREHYVMCQRSGWKLRASDTMREWNGLIVDKKLWDPKHPTVEQPAPRERKQPTYVSGEPADVFDTTQKNGTDL
jgi:hypothetical protein